MVASNSTTIPCGANVVYAQAGLPNVKLPVGVLDVDTVIVKVSASVTVYDVFLDVQ